MSEKTSSGMLELPLGNIFTVCPLRFNQRVRIPLVVRIVECFKLLQARSASDIGQCRRRGRGITSCRTRAAETGCVIHLCSKLGNAVPPPSTQMTSTLPLHTSTFPLHKAVTKILLLVLSDPLPHGMGPRHRSRVTLPRNPSQSHASPACMHVSPPDARYKYYHPATAPLLHDEGTNGMEVGMSTVYPCGYNLVCITWHFTTIVQAQKCGKVGASIDCIKASLM